MRSLLVLAITVALVGCGGDDDDTAPTTGATAVSTTSTTTTSTTTTTTLPPTTTTEPPPPLTISGTFTLSDSDHSGVWNNCYGSGGYDDFGPGMNVTVRNEDGRIVGSGNTRGLREADSSDPQLAPAVRDAKRKGFVCIVKFAVEVDEAAFYEVEIGSRGGLSYSVDELEDADWFVELSLG